MDSIFSQLAKARYDALQRNESFVRIPMPLVAEIIAALIGRKTSEQAMSEKAAGGKDA